MEHQNTDKKKQHYVPKFLLRKFSLDEKERTIALYNIKRNLFIKNSSLRDQAYKDFFYGKDGLIEDYFSKLEGKWATSINSIINNDKILNQSSPQHLDMISFAINLSLRNPTTIFNLEALYQSMSEGALEDEPDISFDLPPQSTILILLKNLVKHSHLASDLSWKLLSNYTDEPFILSDNPVIKYNQITQNLEAQGTGLAMTGLELFLPIGPNHMLIFYDNAVYDVGTKYSSTVKLYNREDVLKLNTLQVLNCDQNLFFNSEINEQYLKEVVTYSSKFQQLQSGNVTRQEVPSDDPNFDKAVMIIGKTGELKLDLTLTFIKSLISSKGYKYLPPIRAKAYYLLETKYKKR